MAATAIVTRSVTRWSGNSCPQYWELPSIEGGRRLHMLGKSRETEPSDYLRKVHDHEMEVRDCRVPDGGPLLGRGFMV